MAKAVDELFYEHILQGVVSVPVGTLVQLENQTKYRRSQLIDVHYFEP
jgi:hypothetical protein